MSKLGDAPEGIPSFFNKYRYVFGFVSFMRYVQILEHLLHKIKMKTKCKRRSKICTYRMNETNQKTYRYLLKKDGMPSRASPSLDAWVSLNIYLGCLGNPKLELVPLLLLLTSRPPRSLITSSTQNSTETFSGGVSEYGNEIPSCTTVTLLCNCKQTLPTVCYHNSRAPSQRRLNKISSIRK